MGWAACWMRAAIVACTRASCPCCQWSSSRHERLAWPCRTSPTVSATMNSRTTVANAAVSLRPMVQRKARRDTVRGTPRSKNEYGGPDRPPLAQFVGRSAERLRRNVRVGLELVPVGAGRSRLAGALALAVQVALHDDVGPAVEHRQLVPARRRHAEVRELRAG